VLGRVTLAVRFVALEGFLFPKGETHVYFTLMLGSSAYEHVPYGHVMFPLVPFIVFSFQQQEVHSARTIGVIADVQRGESTLVTCAKHVYAYRFVHLFTLGDISHVERKSESVSVKRLRVLLYIR